MKKILIALFCLISTSLFAQEKTEQVKVAGNCTMCKKRIEKAAKMEGVSTADWNVESKMLTVSFNSQKTSLEAIERKVSASGHDTQNTTADSEVYNKLPGCCQYERKETGKHVDHKH